MHKKLKIASRSFNLDSQVFSYQKSKVNNNISHQLILKNTLLLPQDRMTRKPLKQWADELREKMRKASLTIDCKHAREIAAIFNDAVILFISLNQVKHARDICYSQIKMFIDCHELTSNEQFLQFALQPWINLVRIDRLTNNVDDAFKKLDIFLDKSKFISNKNSLCLQFIHQHENISHYTTINQAFCERIKLYLYSHEYADLIAFIESQKQNTHPINTWIKREALVISLANQGQFEASRSLLEKAQSQSTPIPAYVFYLREYEMQLNLAKKPGGSHDAKDFFQISLDFLQHHKMNVDIILIGLHAVALLQRADKIDEATKLTYFCLKGAHDINDELLKTDCLVKLYQLIPEMEGKRIIENLMIEHYYHTQYDIARRKLLNCFHDLKYVENQYHHDEITPLFEDLLIFSSRVS